MSFLPRTRKQTEPTQPVLIPGDIIRVGDGALALLVRIGWNGKASPYFNEEDDAKMTRAYVIGLELDEHGNYSMWSDWALVSEIQPADYVGEAVFRDHVLAAGKYTHLFMLESETAMTFAAAV